MNFFNQTDVIGKELFYCNRKADEHNEQGFFFSENLCDLRKPYFSATTDRKISPSFEQEEEESLTERRDGGQRVHAEEEFKEMLYRFTNRSPLMRMIDSEEDEDNNNHHHDHGHNHEHSHSGEASSSSSDSKAV
ncbi:unnamed protein product [Thlaspi arvense]|uniref:Uncharacterized protein n=1 Tax=Thlaspi arvense TaxID=13288 RepID=A0AAU9SAL5_THLAR|nr:unnamed protein product [Thlaspi arvense]